MSIPEATQAQHTFAAEVLRDLLHYVLAGKLRGPDPYVVSHAWTEGPMLYLVYKAPPSDITWGLVSDTRQSLIDPGPWTSLDEAVRYYYLLALEENRVSASFPHPGDPTTILWTGSLDQADLPKRISDILDVYRYTPPVAETLQAPESTGSSDDLPKARRYYDPRQLPGHSEA